mmetsp:Transcript_8737/g.36883  ORF Transcript_8737/g.36883 Transcript_8737/m.36883 type:complete len:214 (+) Transcript_8737:1833-2474(+)
MRCEVMSTPLLRNSFAIPGKARRVSSASRCVTSSQTHAASFPCSSAAFISRSMARATTSRGASSSRSSYRSMNRHPPVGASNSLPPWPRTASVTRNAFSVCARFFAPPGPVYRAVGWNCTNSMFATRAPARTAIATPSPVLTEGLVVLGKSCPAPPAASKVHGARNVSRAPSARRVVSAPTHRVVSSHDKMVLPSPSHATVVAVTKSRAAWNS